MRTFWIAFAHIAALAANGYLVYKYPAAAPAIVPALGAVNALLPSPVTSGQAQGK